VIDPEPDAETIAPVIGDDPSIVKTLIDAGGVVRPVGEEVATTLRVTDQKLARFRAAREESHLEAEDMTMDVSRPHPL
jgi:hypothetical protein